MALIRSWRAHTTLSRTKSEASSSGQKDSVEGARDCEKGQAVCNTLIRIFYLGASSLVDLCRRLDGWRLCISLLALVEEVLMLLRLTALCVLVSPSSPSPFFINMV